LQGRIFSIVLSGSAGSTLVGLTIAGPIVDATSLPLWYILAGSVSVLVGIAGYLLPAVMKIEEGCKTNQNCTERK
jgi:hypothetical protein